MLCIQVMYDFFSKYDLCHFKMYIVKVDGMNVIIFVCICRNTLVGSIITYRIINMFWEFYFGILVLILKILTCTK
jgi:hypothetical protein